jgi:hypothetical protein
VKIQVLDEPEVWSDDSLSFSEKRKRQSTVASVSADSNGNSSFETSRKAHHGIDKSVTVHFLAALQFRKKFDTRRDFVGVYALGQRATEIIHIGQAVLFYGARWNTSATWSSTIQRSQKLTR